MLEPRTFLPPDLVLERFITRTDTPLALLAGREQTREISRCRQELMWLLRQLTTASARQIGEMLGQRTSATVMIRSFNRVRRPCAKLTGGGQGAQPPVFKSRVVQAWLSISASFAVPLQHVLFKHES